MTMREHFRRQTARDKRLEKKIRRKGWKGIPGWFSVQLLECLERNTESVDEAKIVEQMINASISESGSMSAELCGIYALYTEILLRAWEKSGVLIVEKKYKRVAPPLVYN